MRITIGKVLSLLIALIYAVIIVVTEGGITASAFKCCAALLLPLALIWFPEELGSMTGYFWRGSQVDAPSPAILISIFGWFFLVGMPALIYFLS
jgi:hypothetical protein